MNKLINILFKIKQRSSMSCDILYPTQIYINNKRKNNTELIKSFKTHLNKNNSKG